MLFVSLLQRMGFPSDPHSVAPKEVSLQSRPKLQARSAERVAPAPSKTTRTGPQRNRGITTDQPVAGRQAETSAPSEDARRHEQVLSGIERRFLVKAPAKSTAKSKSAATAADKGRSAVAKPAAKKAAQPVAKAPAPKSTPAPKPAPAKPTVTKPAASKPTVTKSAVTKSTPAKPVAAKPVTTKAAAPKAQPAAAVKPVVPATATKATAAASKPLPKPTVAPLASKTGTRRATAQASAAPVAVSVPTHAPDAAKATFSQSIERVMTPPATPAIQKDPKRANNWKSLPVEQLTDLDVQAMPESEYMNDVQLAFFRRKLNLLKEDMLLNAGETTEHLREDTVVVPDPADRATIEEEHALELRTRDRERKLLKKIEQAIARIDAGDYGYCEETGEPIGVARLMARPTASLSLEAQQRRELKQKMFGD